MNTAPRGPRAIEPGYRLDRYELLCPIAEGGMASVWLARIEGKHGFEKLVAVKTILPKFASDDQFEKMLLDEARIASRIEHNNVARILDLGEQHEVLYLVLEWVEGESLSRLSRAVKRKGLDFPQGVMLRILADTCSGLHAAHELRGPDGRLLGVVHRDVSPQNILVSIGGMAKLIDFGIAKAKDRLVGDTSAGVLKGKVRYMAPEQALGRPTDRRADLWAVGCILYRLITGKSPFEGENDLASLNLLTAGKLPPPLPLSTHPSIMALVGRALSFDPEGRFSTAAEMQAAIERAMQDARLVTTTAGVAAFATEHLAPYTERRQNSVKLAMTAASDRQRVRQILQPMVNLEVSTDVSRVDRRAEIEEVTEANAPEAPTTIRDVDPTTTRHAPLGIAPSPPRFLAPSDPPRPTRVLAHTEPPATTRMLAPPDMPPPPRLPTLSEPPRRAFLSDPPAGARASEPPAGLAFSSEPPGRATESSFRFGAPRRTSVIAAAGAVTFLVVLVTLALVGRSRTMSAAASASDPRPRAAPAVVAAPPAPVAASEPTAPATAASPADAVPVISANDLPKAQDTEPVVKWRSPSASPAPTMTPAPTPPRVAREPVAKKEAADDTENETETETERKPPVAAKEAKPSASVTPAKPAPPAGRTRVDDGF